MDEVVRQDPVVSDEPAGASEPRLALKLHPVSPLWSARAAERLRREISALAGVSHENIVRIREWGDQDGAPYIVMDLIDGTRLDEAAPALVREDAVRIVGILPTQVDRRLQMSQSTLATLDTIRERFRIPVLPEIRVDTTVGKSIRARKMLADYDATSRAFKDYLAAFGKLLEVMDGQTAAKA